MPSIISMRATRHNIRHVRQLVYTEKVAQTIQHECLNHFAVLGEKHLRHVLRESVAYHNEQRSHSSRENLPLR